MRWQWSGQSSGGQGLVSILDNTSALLCNFPACPGWSCTVKMVPDNAAIVQACQLPYYEKSLATLMTNGLYRV